MNTVEKLLHTGSRYIKDMDLEDMAAFKFCLASMGVLLGVGIPARMKKPVGLMAGFLFVGTYIPLMSKFVDLYHQTEGGDAPAPAPTPEGGDSPEE